MTLASLVDYFIHSDHFDDPTVLRRARLFVRACLLTSMFSTSYVALSIVFEYEKGVYLMLFNVIGFLFLPILAKTKIPIAILGNVYVFIGSFAVIVLTYFSGGMWSAIYPWIISIPVLALLVVNKMSGAIWGAIAFLAMIWFGLLAISGTELPVEYNPELKTVWFVSILPGLLLIILFISFVFEAMQSKALKELETSNGQLIQQKQTIELQSEELEKLIEEKDYIIRILAHDIRGPLKNIKSLVQLVQLEKEDGRKVEYMQMVTQASDNAQHLVERVLEMDASSQEDVKIYFESVDLKHLIYEVFESFEEAASSKNIQLELANKSHQWSVKTDKTYLALVLENLVSNAIKFSFEGKKVTIKVSDEVSGKLQIRVIDQGQGIIPEEQKKLFRKFSKLSARPTGGESSTGLGLSLVKRYITLIGGKVWYENDNSKGSVFVVELPNSLVTDEAIEK